jgi:hypothetical protein
MGVFNGVAPANDLGTQLKSIQNLLHSSGIQDQNVLVQQAVDLSGTVILQAPANITQQTLTAELQAVPGFSFVQDYTPDKGPDQEDDTSGVNGDFANGDYIVQTYGPFDYQQLLSLEKNGPVGGPGGPVTPPPGANDVLTNNNGGNLGTQGFTHSETTTIAFGNTVLVGFNDSGSYTGTNNKFTGYAYSTDGGTTWTDGGVLPTNPNGDVGDPILARDNTSGRIYYGTLQFSGSGMDVFHSDDGGVTWSAPAQGAPGRNGFQDKEWIAVDNFAGPGQGNVYLVNRDFGSGNGIFFTRSTDQGNTFGPSGGTAIALAGATQGAFVTVTPDHAVEVYWFNGSVIQMRKSTDQGITFGAPVTVVSGLIGGTNGDLGLTGIRNGTSTPSGFRSNEFPHAAVNPANGNIYVTFDNKGPGSDKADVFLTQSTDGGATWSAPIRVNDDATTTDQWQPTIAVTPDGSKLGIFYYSRQEDTAGDNLFKYYGRVASISGSTLTFAPSFAVSSVASLPEFGRDSIVNSVYMGDYNTAYATPGAFYVSWSDNRNPVAAGSPRMEPDVFFQKVALGLQVVSTVPAVGSIVSSAPTTFTVNVTDPINPGSLTASAFKVNGIAATSDSYTVGSTTITFSFPSTPVTAPGLQTMHIDAGAFTRASDGSPVGQFDGTFRFAPVQLQVTSTNPPVGGTILIPPSTVTFDVNFNTTVDPSSVHTTSLSLSGIAGAFVSGVSVLPGDTTARFTLAGITTDEGTLTASIAAGAITDSYGNPILPFSGSYVIDAPTQAFPTPLAAASPAGSSIYSGSVSDTISTASDVESYTLAISAGQLISVLVSPTVAGLRPTVQLLDPSNNVIGTFTAGGAGQNALLETIPATVAGTYKIVVSGAGGTTGTFTATVTLNAALEQEGLLPGVDNNTLATAQDLTGAFSTVQTTLNTVQRGAVRGTSDNSGYGASVITPTFEEISGTGTGTLQNTDDSVNQLTAAQLGGFQFPFYGNTYTSLFYSTNGLITFGAGNG